MKFFNQIGIEIKNIFRSKFMLITGILILAASIVFPIISVIGSNRDGRPQARRSILGGAMTIAARPYYNDEEPITVDGVTVEPESPFYWNIRNMTEEKDRFENDSNMFSSPEALDMVLDMMDAELEYYLYFASQITTNDDYRRDLAWTGNNTLYDKFIYENYDPETVDALKEALNYRYGIPENTFEDKYVDITSEERLAAIDEANEFLDNIYEVVESKDFTKYIDLRIQQSNDDIADLEEQIEIQEQNIIDNPSQEESLSRNIEDLEKQIDMIKTSTIPILKYRLQENIIPGEDRWENQALNEVSSCRSQLAYTTIMTEEEFSRDQWMAEQYGTYTQYVASVQAEIDDLNNRLLVAERCLETGKPDMKFVPRGARNITVNFLGYSTFIALFAVMIGGWIIASEYQQGTIRLLMIRPRTRMKILMSKYLAVLLLCFGIFAAGSLINLIMNGICFGFGDYLYPNVTVSGPINFFAYYLPRFLACLVPIVFGFSVAFMLSVLVRNAAVSIAVPIFCFIGSVIAMSTLAYRNANYTRWLAWTPIPYVQINNFFSDNSMIDNMLQRGIPLSVPYGILLMLGLSAICVVVAMRVFKKRDITN